MRCHGNFFVGVTTINQRGEMILESTTEVAQQTTVHTFNSQGSQEEVLGWEWTPCLPRRAVRFRTLLTLT